MKQSEYKAIPCTCSQPQAQENMHEQVTIGFGFASHWTRKWCNFCQPITEQSYVVCQSFQCN